MYENECNWRVDVLEGLQHCVNGNCVLKKEFNCQDICCYATLGGQHWLASHILAMHSHGTVYYNKHSQVSRLHVCRYQAVLVKAFIITWSCHATHTQWWINIHCLHDYVSEHTWNKDTWLIRTLHWVSTLYKYILFSPWNKDTSLIRTIILVSRVFHIREVPSYTQHTQHVGQPEQLRLQWSNLNCVQLCVLNL